MACLDVKVCATAYILAGKETIKGVQSHRHPGTGSAESASWSRWREAFLVLRRHRPQRRATGHIHDIPTSYSPSAPVPCGTVSQHNTSKKAHPIGSMVGSSPTQFVGAYQPTQRNPLIALLHDLSASPRLRVGHVLPVRTGRRSQAVHVDVGRRRHVWRRIPTQFWTVLACPRLNTIERTLKTRGALYGCVTFIWVVREKSAREPTSVLRSPRHSYPPCSKNMLRSAFIANSR